MQEYSKRVARTESPKCCNDAGTRLFLVNICDSGCRYSASISLFIFLIISKIYRFITGKSLTLFKLHFGLNRKLK
jgi:hypothetical protein